MSDISVTNRAQLAHRLDAFEDGVLDVVDRLSTRVHSVQSTGLLSRVGHGLKPNSLAR